MTNIIKDRMLYSTREEPVKPAYRTRFIQRMLEALEDELAAAGDRPCLADAASGQAITLSQLLANCRETCSVTLTAWPATV